jgi:hypothetical protein
MDEKTLRDVIQLFGDKLYELQVGFASIFNLCIDKQVFTETAFHQERLKLEALPDFQMLRAALKKLSESTEQEDLEAFLRAYKGPVQ